MSGTADEKGVVVRQAARVVLLDPRERVLLFYCRDPQRDEPPFWLTPGGGLEAGETFEAACRREVYEETGLTDLSLSPCVWMRRHAFVYRDWQYDQYERYFVARTVVTRVAPVAEDVEMHDQLGHRWWAVDEMLASDEQFAPRRLAVLLRDLLRDGPPALPVDVGV